MQNYAPLNHQRQYEFQTHSLYIRFVQAAGRTEHTQAEKDKRSVEASKKTPPAALLHQRVNQIITRPEIKTIWHSQPRVSIPVSIRLRMRTDNPDLPLSVRSN